MSTARIKKLASQSNGQHVPKCIHFIWTGGPLKKSHIAKYKQWQRLNPNYTVNLWVDAEYMDHIKNVQLKNTSIQIKNLSSLSLPTHTRKFIKAITNKKNKRIVPNYAAVSDLLRFYILQTGGWYLEPDIEPIKLDTIKIDPKFKFLIQGAREQNSLVFLTPSAIAASKNNPMIRFSLEIIDEITKSFASKEWIELICSKIDVVRGDATIFTNGAVMQIAWNHLLIDNLPILEDNTAVASPKVFDKLTCELQEIGEKSWIYTEAPSDTKNGQIKPLENISLSKNGDQQKYQELYINKIYQVLMDIYSKMKPIHYDQYSKQHKHEVPTTATSFDEVNEHLNMCSESEDGLFGFCGYFKDLIGQCPSYFLPHHYLYRRGNSFFDSPTQASQPTLSLKPSPQQTLK